MDMFHYQDLEHEMVIEGFPTLEDAVEYARRRTRDSLEEHRRPGQSKEELRKLWWIFGEDVLVVGGNYSGNHELDYFIEHAATRPEECDWMALERKFGSRLRKSSASE